MKLRLLLGFWFCSLACTCFGSEGWVLVNRQVPAARELGQGYLELHGGANIRLIEVDLPPLEKVEASVLEEELLPLLLKVKGDGSWPRWMLSVYGMPLWTSVGDRVVAVDQWLSCRSFDRYELGRLVYNPEFFEELDGPRWQPIHVLRLDGPALRHAQRMLESWARLKHWGGFRRCFPYEEQGLLASMLASEGHLVQAREEFFKVRPHEIQFWECRDDELLMAVDEIDEGALPPGAMIFHYHNQGGRDLPFRSPGASSSSVAALWGASFFVGALAPKRAEEDLFDSQLFFSRYLRGMTFSESVWASAPSLGGSLLILGDPLAQPYSDLWEAHRSKGFMEAREESDRPEFIQAMGEAKDWWLIRDHLHYWEKARFEMVFTTLRVALLQRQSPIFFEVLARCYQQLGRDQALRSVWRAWPSSSQGEWEQFLRKQWNIPDDLGVRSSANTEP